MYGMGTHISRTHRLSWHTNYTIGLLFISAALIFLATMTLTCLVLIRNNASNLQVVAEHFASLAIGIILTSITTFYLFIDNDGILAQSRPLWIGSIVFLGLTLAFSLAFLTIVLYQKR
jgi:hypothetical protein